MTTFRFLGVLVTAVGLALLGGSPARAGTYIDAANHYEFAVFDNWLLWPAQTLAAANQFARGRAGAHKIEYAAGFQPRGTPLGSYPYMLLQIQPHSNTNSSYEDIERGLANASGRATREVKGALADIIKDFSLDNALLDRANNRVIFRYQVNAPMVGNIEGISVANIGKEAIVSLHYYDHADKFTESVKSFFIMANSFDFEKEFRFKAVAPVLSGSTQMTMIVGLAVFAVIAVGAVLWQARHNSENMNWSSLPKDDARSAW